MLEGAHVRLALSNRPDNVPIVRQALAGLAHATGLSHGDLNDIATAVTEACNNVCVHAYGGGEGPLEVELHSAQEAVLATVRDRGLGLALDARVLPVFPVDVDGELAGIGLPSIKAIASHVRWTETVGGGTSVQMTFSTAMPALRGWSDVGHELDRGSKRDPGYKGEPRSKREPGGELGHEDELGHEGKLGHEGELGQSPFEPCELGGTIEVAMTPLAVAREVLIRLLHATAARARFSIDRHAEIQRVGAALLADPQDWTSSGGIHARLIAGPDTLELALGPISRARARLLAEAATNDQPRLCGSVDPIDGQRHTLVVRLEGARS